MAVDVYVDVLFLINCGMDVLCLLLTARLMHIPCKNWRLLLASALGGCYAVWALFVDMGQPWALAVDLAVCLVMCLVCFGKRGEIGRLPMQGVVYVAISMVMGGVMTALYEMLRRAGVAELLPAGEDGLSSVAFLLLAGLGGLLTHLWGRFFKKSNTVSRCTLTVRMGSASVTLSGMVDSGNLLRDPMGGGVVIPVKTEAATPLLSVALREMLARGQTEEAELWMLPEASRIRIIPTGTATGQGLLIALRPDEILLTPDGKKPYTVKALISPTPLPEAPADALVPLELMA